MKTKLRLMNPIGITLRSVALAMFGWMGVFWLGRHREAERTSRLADISGNCLRTSEAILDNAATICHVGAWQLALPAMDITWSRELFVIMEVPPDYKPSLDAGLAFYLPDDRRVLSDALNECITSGQSYALELHVVTAKHRPLLVKVVGEAVRDGAGVITHIQGALQDISVTRLAELSQLLVASRLLTTLETISDGVVTFDTQCRFTYVNAQAERLLHRKRAELLGNVIGEVFPQGLTNQFEQHYQAVMKDSQPVHFEEFYAPASVWLDISVYPSDEGLAVYLRDVTKRRADHAELALLKTAISRINDIVLITEAEPIDAPGPRIVYVNDAFERRTGYSRAEVIGLSPKILQGPNTSRVELDRVRVALKAWQPVRSELVNYTKSGEQFWIEMDISPIADASGWYTHWVAVERDVTERRFTVNEILRLNSELEERVDRRTAQLNAVNKELQAFSYSVSHDLRAPLSTLDGFTALLAKRESAVLSEKGLHYLNRIRTSAQQMGELIDGLLVLAKSANEPVVRVPVNLTELAQRISRECQERNADQQVVLHIQDGMLVNADALLMSVVLHNLIGNAFKFTSKTLQPEVTVGSQPGKAEQPIYFVKDNGAGFDEAFADKLFGIFQRLHTDSDYAGTGIGLANVKRVIEHHGGTVWAKGRVGEGAVFYFTLG
jgi:PAS domain S-box-containing protein